MLHEASGEKIKAGNLFGLPELSGLQEPSPTSETAPAAVRLSSRCVTLRVPVWPSGFRMAEIEKAEESPRHRDHSGSHRIPRISLREAIYAMKRQIS
jgi:hypothetical protein